MTDLQFILYCFSHTGAFMLTIAAYWGWRDATRRYAPPPYRESMESTLGAAIRLLAFLWALLLFNAINLWRNTP